ncbi:MAG: hypothetical protein R2847_10725 [Bacteroidia bacterium]
MQLAPDGKIYVSTGNGTMHIHVINNPDSAGTACDGSNTPFSFNIIMSVACPTTPIIF